MDMLKISLLLSLLLFSSCSNHTSRTVLEHMQAVTRIDSTVEYVGPGNVHLSEAQYPKDVVLMFPSISGAIFGTQSETPVYITKVDERLNFSVDLMAQIKEVKNASIPLTEEWTAHGLAIEPVQARIARIGTFPYSYETGLPLGSGGFINLKTRNTMILVYVDRSCAIKGEVNLDGEHYFHDLEFANEGFHWIEVIRRSRAEFILQTYHGKDDINFSIHIEELHMI